MDKQNVITIPAREVVLGMLSPIGAPLCMRLIDSDVVEVAQVGYTGRLLKPLDPVAVILPGPSPRKVLCTCPDDWQDDITSATPLDEHASECLVYCLDVALWPRPMPGQDGGWGWAEECGEYVARMANGRVYYVSHHALLNGPDGTERGRLLHAAFFATEMTP